MMGDGDKGGVKWLMGGSFAGDVMRVVKGQPL
jgi:hypothetical protein